MNAIDVVEAWLNAAPADDRALFTAARHMGRRRAKRASVVRVFLKGIRRELARTVWQYRLIAAEIPAILRETKGNR